MIYTGNTVITPEEFSKKDIIVDTSDDRGYYICWNMFYLYMDRLIHDGAIKNESIGGPSAFWPTKKAADDFLATWLSDNK